jgi:hypothetical protein
LYNLDMTSKFLKTAGLAFFAAIFFLVGNASAATPTVSVPATGSGDNVYINVTGDPNYGVILNYLGSSSNVQMSSLGTTNSNGSFSITVSTQTYGITPGSLFYVTVNNQNSQTLTWPYTTTGSTGSLSLNQTNVTLQIGQSVVISANNNGASSLFLSSNSSPSVANVTLNGNQFTVTATTAGSTTLTVCSLASTSNCASATITVPGSGSSLLTFSQNNISIPYGQTSYITVGGGTGSYYISSNSNASVIAASISGSVVSLYANGSSGSASITVCSSNMSTCGVINASASSSSNSSALSFSQTNPTVAPGQTAVVTVSGGSGTYYVSSNSNPASVQANLVGSTLTIYGNSTGSGSLTICSSSGGCGVLTVTVAVPGTTSITLSQTSLTVSTGQTLNTYITGVGGYYISTNSSPSVATASISGNYVAVTGYAAGTTNITVCQTGGQCAILYVTVTGSTGTVSGAPSLTHILSVGQGINLLLSGGLSPYSLSSNSGSVFTSKITNGNVLTIAGVAAGTASVNICSSSGACITLTVTVVNSSLPTGNSGNTGTPSSYRFYNYLTYGYENDEVMELQKRLAEEGVYSGPITGYYGDMTIAAVKKYQSQNGLSPVGSVGPATRALLNR